LSPQLSQIDPVVMTPVDRYAIFCGQGTRSEDTEVDHLLKKCAIPTEILHVWTLMMMRTWLVCTYMYV